MKSLPCRRSSIPLAAALTVCFYALAAVALFLCAADFSERTAAQKSQVLVLRLKKTQAEEKFQKAAESKLAQQPEKAAAASRQDSREFFQAVPFAVNTSLSANTGVEENLMPLSGAVNGADNSPEAAKNAFLRELDGKIRQNLIYPERARKRNAEGTVTADIGITTEGALFYCKLAESSGSSLLDEAAILLLKAVFPLSSVPSYAFETNITITYRLQ